MSVYDLNGTYHSVSEGFLADSRKTLEGAYLRIEHCLSQIHENDAWWRPHEEMNAIGNIVLHLVGNMSQWILAGVGKQEFQRDRKTEFAQRDPIPLDELRLRLHVVVEKADRVMASLHEADLLRPCHIQGFDTNTQTAIYHAISHFEGHAQEIIYITRQRLGGKYQFLFEVNETQQNSS